MAAAAVNPVRTGWDIMYATHPTRMPPRKVRTTPTTIASRAASAMYSGLWGGAKTARAPKVRRLVIATGPVCK
jgi:hypothetical protein